MDLYLFQNEEQVGPYTKEQITAMIESGEITRDDFVWHEGLSDWQPIHTIMSAGSPASAPKAHSTEPQESTQHKEINTNVKQGAIIGGWVCFGLGMTSNHGSTLTPRRLAPPKSKFLSAISSAQLSSAASASAISNGGATVTFFPNTVGAVTTVTATSSEAFGRIFLRAGVTQN